MFMTLRSLSAVPRWVANSLVVWFVLVCQIGYAQTATQDAIEAGAAALSRGHTATAYRAWIDLARAGNAQALLLATRQFRRFVVETITQTDCVDDAVDPWRIGLDVEVAVRDGAERRSEALGSFAQVVADVLAELGTVPFVVEQVHFKIASARMECGSGS